MRKESDARLSRLNIFDDLMKHKIEVEEMKKNVLELRKAKLMNNMENVN